MVSLQQRGRPRGPGTDNNKEHLSHTGQSVPEALPGDRLSGPLRAECYAGPRGQPPCASLLGRNTTKAECCCTQGAGWGDACEPCPAQDSGEAPNGPKSSRG